MTIVIPTHHYFIHGIAVVFLTIGLIWFSNYMSHDTLWKPWLCDKNQAVDSCKTAVYALEQSTVIMICAFDVFFTVLFIFVGHEDFIFPRNSTSEASHN